MQSERETEGYNVQLPRQFYIPATQKISSESVHNFFR